MITDFNQLSYLGQIIYARRESGAITNATVQLYATRGKIPQEEADFIIVKFP